MKFNDNSFLKTDKIGNEVSDWLLSPEFEYIHYNPVKHGLARAPKDWPYSSFHDYVKKGFYNFDWAAGVEVEFNSEVGRE